MPEPGGTTTESGILYQNSIAALYLGRLCDDAPRPDRGRVVGVRVEAPEQVDDTVVTFADDHRIFIQAKEHLDIGREVWRRLWPDFAAQFLGASFRRGTDRLELHIGEPLKSHHDLQEACLRAGTAADYAEWSGRMSQAQQAIVENIWRLVGPALATDADVTLDEAARYRLVDVEVLALFSHIDVEFASLIQIERDQALLWMPASSNYLAHTLFRLLRDRVGGHARRRGSFDAIGLKGQLRSDDRVEFLESPNLALLRQSVRACGAVLLAYKHTLGATGRHLPRAVTGDIVAWAREATSDRQVGMLLDQAGAGKTVILRDALRALEDGGGIVLAIKADQQLASVATVDDLQRTLGLPVSVERAVALLAAHGPVVVLIDQIDALSLTLVRDHRAIDLVLGLVARLRLIPDVRVVIACRTFDRNTDPRLKRLDVAREFVPAPLADDAVAEIVGAVGVDRAVLSPATRELLRTPHHLDLFIRLAEERGGAQRLGELHGLSTLQDLYALLWHDLVRRPDLAAPPIAEREEVLRIMTARMARDQRTTVPQTLFATPENARLLPAANWLASVGILVSNSITWSFLHQTFFDYCYARHYVESGARLSETLLRSEQGLFARSQLTQVLAYLRANDEATYIHELNVLLRSEGLRFHLRDLLVRWFGALPTPTDHEWEVARRLLMDPAMRPPLFGSMGGNVGWFARLSGKTLEGLLALDDGTLDATIMPYLLSLCEVAQVEVARIVAPFLERGERWRNRAAWLLAYIREWRAVEAVALFERLLRLVPTSDPVRLHALKEIAHSHPEAGCRLIRLLLDRALDTFLAGRAAVGSPPISLFRSDLEIPGGRILTDAMEAARQAAPRHLVDAILPWLERVVALPGEDSEVAPYYGYDPLSHSWRSDGLDAAAEVARAFTAALTELARREPAAFRPVAARLAALPYETPQQILTRVYRAVPDAYADEAAQFLLGDRRRLTLGEREQYDSRQVLAAIYPFLSAERRTELEAYILDHAPFRKYRSVPGLRWWRIEQFYFLQAIPRALLTARGADRLRELERKFPGVAASASPSLIQAGMVAPPIPPECAARMSDRAWLRAMRRYRGAVRHREFLKGGAHQLAGVLQREVREHPERFHRLALRTPRDTDEAYVGAFLQGLAEAAAPDDRLFAVVRRFADHPGRELGQAVAWALEKRAAGLPDDLLDLLERRVRDRPGAEEGGERDPYSRYLNSDRGAAFRTLMRGLERRGAAGAQERRWALIRFAAGDSSTALRAGAIEELLYLLQLDRARAVALFEVLLSGHPALLESHWTREFLYSGLYRYYPRMRPFIRAMMESDDDRLGQGGAELACIATIWPRALDTPAALEDARLLAEEAITGPAPWRRGAARVYAENVVGDASAVAVAGLQWLLADDDREVRRFVGGAFRSLRDEHVSALRAFIDAYAASFALHDGTGQFAEFLWEHGMIAPDWALAVVETTLRNERPAGDTGGFHDGEVLIRLVLRIYIDPTSAHLRERAMDAFDALMSRFTGDALRALADWDRQ